MVEPAQMPPAPVPDEPSAPATQESPAEDVLSLYVSDLPPYATDADLQSVFSYPLDHLPGDALGSLYIHPFTITDIRMVNGTKTGSRYAFVRFGSVAERTRALYIMQGLLCIGRPIRLSRAHSKDRARDKAELVLFTHERTRDERQRDNIVIDQFNSQWASVDPKNTKVFVGGISPRASLQELVSRFAAIGPITNVNFGKGCAFISFARKHDAALAIERFDGIMVEGKSLRVTWSRSSVQPLLQQQRTIIRPSPPTSEGSSPEGKITTHTPSSPVSPITPSTPFGNQAFPQVAGSTARVGNASKSRSGSLSSKASMTGLPNLYPLREMDEPTSSTTGLELAPALARRRTVANVARHRAGLLDSDNSSPFTSLNTGDANGLNTAAPMGRRVSLPENAL